jgi:hypothetical protein
MGHDTMEKYTPYSERSLALLPKYKVSAGRGQTDSVLSLARIYFRDSAPVRKLFDTASAYGSVDDMVLDARENDTPLSYVGFLLQRVNETRREKVQSIPLQGDSSHTTFFGESPRQYNFSGILFNSTNARWRELFTFLYEKAFRGSIAAAKSTPLQIIYDNKVVTGWMTSLTQDLNSSNELMVPFSFSLLVVRDSTLTSDTQLKRQMQLATLDKSEDKYLDKYMTLLNREGEVATQLGVDDYVRKAAIKLPPNPRVVSRGGRGGCRIKGVTKNRYGRTSGVSNTQGAVSSTSPTTSSCDLSEAIIKHRSDLEAAQKKYEAAVTDKKKKIASKYLDQVEKAEKQLRLAQGWLGKTDLSESVSKEVARAKEMLVLSGGHTPLTGFSKGSKTPLSTRLKKRLKSMKKG